MIVIIGRTVITISIIDPDHLVVVVTDFVGTDLVVADLVVADLVAADLVAADLIAADLVVAELVTAVLVTAMLVAAVLVAAELVTNFHDRVVSVARVRSAFAGKKRIAVVIITAACWLGDRGTSGLHVVESLTVHADDAISRFEDPVDAVSDFRVRSVFNASWHWILAGSRFRIVLDVAAQMSHSTYENVADAVGAAGCASRAKKAQNGREEKRQTTVIATYCIMQTRYKIYMIIQPDESHLCQITALVLPIHLHTKKPKNHNDDCGDEKSHNDRDNRRSRMVLGS